MNTALLFEQAFAASPERVRLAALKAHGLLLSLGIPHALIGGAAVAAYGFQRATTDVDFLVGPEAFDVRLSGLVTFVPGVPIEIEGVKIDYLSPVSGEELALMESPDARAVDLAIIPLEVLIAMKLRAGRMKDNGDIVELLIANGDAATLRIIRAHLATAVLDRQAAKFERLVEAANEESDR